MIVFEIHFLSFDILIEFLRKSQEVITFGEYLLWILQDRIMKGVEEKQTDLNNRSMVIS